MNWRSLCSLSMKTGAWYLVRKCVQNRIDGVAPSWQVPPNPSCHLPEEGLTGFNQNRNWLSSEGISQLWGFWILQGQKYPRLLSFLLFPFGLPTTLLLSFLFRRVVLTRGGLTTLNPRLHPAGGHLAMSEGILAVTLRFPPGIYWVEVTDAAKSPIKHRTNPPSNRKWPSKNVKWEVEKSCWWWFSR